MRRQHERQTVAAGELERGQRQELPADPVVVDQDVIGLNQPIERGGEQARQAVGGERNERVVGKHPGQHPQPG